MSEDKIQDAIDEAKRAMTFTERRHLQELAAMSEDKIQDALDEAKRAMTFTERRHLQELAKRGRCSEREVVSRIIREQYAKLVAEGKITP